MIHKNDLIENIKVYSKIQIDQIANTNLMIKFIKPMITRAVDNYIDKSSSMLQYISDKDGNIDAINMLQEIKSNMIMSDPFVIKGGVFGDIIVGNGSIKINVPMIDLKISFNSLDIDCLIDTISSNNKGSL